MDIEYITQLALEFRKALEFVAANKKYGRLTMFAGFPKECCGYTSDLLATYLMEKGISRERIQRINGTTREENYTHCWLMIDESFYLDITADQFDKKAYFKDYSPIPSCHVVPKGTSLYECFNTECSLYFGIETYGGDVPSKLQDVYTSIIKQLKRQ